MAGNFSFSGGQPRCFTFWRDFQKCYATADRASDCLPQAEDYEECLHQRKEIARASQIQAHYKAKQSRELEAQKREHAAEVSGIMALGLARREREEKEAKEAKEKGGSDEGGKENGKQDGGDKGGDDD